MINSLMTEDSKNPKASWSVSLFVQQPSSSNTYSSSKGHGGLLRQTSLKSLSMPFFKERPQKQNSLADEHETTRFEIAQ
jgi:hypothetical protein